MFWLKGAGRIMDFEGEHPGITTGALDALANARLLLCARRYETTTSKVGSHVRQTEGETGRKCTLLGKAFDAVDSGFALPDEATTRITIGAIIQSMSGGNVQAVGIAQDADISQVANDPDLLRSQVEALTENLLDEVKSSLKVDELADYAQAIRDLREQLLAERPQPTLIRHSVRTIGLLGDIEGTIGLMTRVWTFLHPLLLIAAARWR